MHAQLATEPLWTCRCWMRGTRLGTRCPYLEQHLKKNARHKHMLFLLNKCDLVRCSGLLFSSFGSADVWYPSHLCDRWLAVTGAMDHAESFEHGTVPCPCRCQPG